jgi:hypothetical protein
MPERGIQANSLYDLAGFVKRGGHSFAGVIPWAALQCRFSISRQFLVAIGRDRPIGCSDRYLGRRVHRLILIGPPVLNRLPAGSAKMPDPDRTAEQAIRETAYFIWERDGRPDGLAQDHWRRAAADCASRASPHDESLDDEEKILAGYPNVNMTALLTRDVPGG